MRVRKIKPVLVTWRFFRQRWLQYKNNRMFKRLRKIKTPEELLDYVYKIEHGALTRYYELGADYRRKVFLALFDWLEGEVKNRSFLDIGPGLGDSLDIAKERGASAIEFVDQDPFYSVWCELKGFKGYTGFNYITGDGLTPVQPNKFDIILSKGSINSDRFNRKEAGLIPIAEWLSQIDSIANEGADIFITPTFDKGADPKTSYHCKDVEAFKQSMLSKTMTDFGYHIIFLDGFNHPQKFPVTFYKSK